MIRLIPVVFLAGCAQFAELGEQRQDRELENNRAEVIYADREICRQIRANTIFTVYGDRLDEWHKFCGYKGAP